MKDRGWQQSTEGRESKLQSTATSTRMHRSSSHRDALPDYQMREFCAKFTPFEESRKDSKTLNSLDSHHAIDTASVRFNEARFQSVRGQERHPKPLSVVRLLREAEKVGPSDRKPQVFPTTPVKLQPVTDPTQEANSVVKSLLSTLGINSCPKCSMTFQNVPELATIISQHFHHSLSEVKQKMPTTSEAIQELQPREDNIDHLKLEIKRLRQVVYKMQNDQKAIQDQSESDRIKQLQSEKESLQRKVADLIDLLKRKEEEYGVGLVVFEDSSSQTMKNKDGRISLGTRKMAKRDEPDWKLVAEEQRKTIENLTVLVENLRFENRGLSAMLDDTVQKKSTGEEKLKAKSAREMSESRPKAVDQGLQLKEGRRHADLRQRIRSISRGEVKVSDIVYN